MSVGELARLIDRHARPDGAMTSVPRQHLVAEARAVSGKELGYTPMVCFVASGAKRVEVGELAQVVSAGEVFLGVIDAPAQATFDPPHRPATLRLDEFVVVDMLAEASQTPVKDVPAEAFTTAGMDAGLLDAVVRWVGLLDEPEHIAALPPGAETEIVYRLLVGPLGRASTSAMSAGPMAQVRKATRYLTEHYSEAVTIARLASAAGMSAALLHRHFKALTDLTPMQFQRATRLQQARRLLLGADHNATTAALAVGYLSPSQFSRDHRRRYGLPPRKDAARLRSKGPGD